MIIRININANRYDIVKNVVQNMQKKHATFTCAIIFQNLTF